MRGERFRTYQQQKPGQGVPPLRPKKMTAEEARIEELGKLDERRLQCGGDRDCLHAVADCYEQKGMVRTAKQIRREAEG
jgi:hypothetical protein